METTQILNHDFVYCLAASPYFEQDGLVYAAKQSGLYRSTNWGSSWKDAYASLQLDSALPTTFVALGQTLEKELIVYACVEGKILRSLDGCNTWQIFNISSQAPITTSLIISPDFNLDSTLFIGTIQDGIFRSTNGGLTWNGWNFGLFDHSINTIVISPNYSEDQTLLAGTQSGIFRSLNGGRSWRDLPFSVDLAPVLSLAIHPEGRILAGTEEKGLHFSDNGGITWEQMLEGAVEQILYSDDKIFLVRDSGLQWSDNSGKSWKALLNGELKPISCLSAPFGSDSSPVLLVGLSNGDITICETNQG
jgi:photosystem II stability/assembly factor-like uncharacterized protein